MISSIKWKNGKKKKKKNEEPVPPLPYFPLNVISHTETSNVSHAQIKNDSKRNCILELDLLKRFHNFFMAFATCFWLN